MHCHLVDTIFRLIFRYSLQTFFPVGEFRILFHPVRIYFSAHFSSDFECFDFYMRFPSSRKRTERNAHLDNFQFRFSKKVENV